MLDMHSHALVGDILRHTFEAVTLEDLGAEVLPLLARLLDTSATLIYRCRTDHRLDAVAGSLVDVNPEYDAHHQHGDPLRDLRVRLNRRLFCTAHHPEEWQRFLRSPVHLDYSRHHGVHSYAHVRLTDAPTDKAGSVAIVLARAHGQPTFSEDELLTLGRLLPALNALAARSARAEDRLAAHAVLDGVVCADAQPKLALDRRGGLLWASRRAAALLRLGSTRREAVPEALADAVRRLGALIATRTPDAVPPPRVILRPDTGGPPIPAALRLARKAGGEPFIVVELTDPAAPTPLDALADRTGLTPAERRVLEELKGGFADQEIAERLFVSVGTVRTHVGRVLSKLGVASRLQAALLASGVPLAGRPPADDDQRPDGGDDHRGDPEDTRG